MSTPGTLSIGSRIVGAGKPCFIIAEAGVNHNGDTEVAKRLVDVATEAHADAVKFQTFSADRLVAPAAPKAGYQLKNTEISESQFDMLRRLELPRSVYPDLVDYCRKRDIIFLSTPFDEESADFLGELSVAAFKIPSGEVTNLPLLEHIARKGKPMIVSTGMCNLEEVGLAVETIKCSGDPDLVLLHCVSRYPADPSDANIRAMVTLQEEFGVRVGYSDHVRGPEAALAAVALGACVIEKHFTLDRNLPGPDHQASIEPDELKALVRSIRTLEACLGDGKKVPTPAESDTAAVARRSLVAAQDIAEGKVLTMDLIAIKRPGTGLPPAQRASLVGRTARQHIPAGTILKSEMFV